MLLATYLRWLAFAGYTVLLFSGPPATLWGLPGFLTGASAACIFLIALRYKGSDAILGILTAKPLTAAQAPREHALVEEYCRRLKIGLPGIHVIEVAGLNVAVLGFSAQATHLVFTRGLLEQLTRPQLAAVIAHSLCRIRNSDVANETWLARFFGLVYSLIHTGKSRKVRTDVLSVQVILRQLILYPLTLFPTLVLKGMRDETALDLRSIEITRDAQSLAEAFRRMEALAERTPFRAPFATRHLFLASPPSADPLTRVLFDHSGLGNRVRVVESRLRTVPMT